MVVAGRHLTSIIANAQEKMGPCPVFSPLLIWAWSAQMDQGLQLGS